MAQFQRKDSHFVVYFPTDKTVHVLSKAKIIFQSESFEDENVKVMWKTSNIKEDGTVVVEDMAYDGVIVFSGSLIQCRNYSSQVNEEINLAEEKTITSLVLLAKEIKSSAGKRGASIKLKRAIEAEAKLEEKNPKKKKSHEMGFQKITAKELKIKEMMAFAGIDSIFPTSHVQSPAKEKQSASATPQKRTSAYQPKRLETATKSVTPVKEKQSATPQKRTPAYQSKRLETATKSVTPVKEKHSATPRKRTPAYQPKRPGTATKSVTPAKEKQSATPQKRTPAYQPKRLETATKSVTPVKEKQSATPRKRTPAYQPKRLETATKSVTPVKEKQSATPQKRNPAYQPKRLETATKSVTPVKEKHSATPRKRTPAYQPKRPGTATKSVTPAKEKQSATPQKRTPAYQPKRLETATKSVTPVKEKQSATPQKRTPAYQPKRLETATKSVTPVKEKQSATPRKRTPAYQPKRPGTATKSVTPVKEKRSATPQKRTPAYQPRRLETATKSATPVKAQEDPTVNDISSLIGESLGVLHENEEELLPEFDQSYTAYQPSQQNYQGEYGFNATAADGFPFHSLMEYYQGLPFEVKTQILSFCHVLISSLHECTYGGCGPEYNSMGSTSFGIIQQGPEKAIATMQKTCTAEQRKLPLIKDGEDLYNDVVVNPSSLRAAEMKALTSKNPSVYLLNKVLEMVFTGTELQQTKGAKGLDGHKMDAVKEYMYARCQNLNIDHLPPKSFTSTVQNKIGNARQKANSTKVELALHKTD